MQDPHVDRAYHREEMLASILAAQKNHDQGGAAGEGVDATDDLAKKLEHTLILKPTDTSTTLGVVTGTLASLIAKFVGVLSFEPEIEEVPVHIRKLPDELLVMVLRKLDPTSIERFATINRKARVLALDSNVWRCATSMYCTPLVMLNKIGLLSGTWSPPHTGRPKSPISKAWFPL